MNVSSDALAFAIVAASMTVGVWRGFGKATAQLLIGCVSVAIGIYFAMLLRTIWAMHGGPLDVEGWWLALSPVVVFLTIVGCVWVAAWRAVHLNAKAFEGRFSRMVHRVGGAGIGGLVGALLVGVLQICFMPISEQVGGVVSPVGATNGVLLLRRYARFASLGYRDVREAFTPLRQHPGDDRSEVRREDEEDEREDEEDEEEGR